MQLTECKGLIRLYWAQLRALDFVSLSVGVTTVVQHCLLVGAASYFRSHSRVFASPCTPAAAAWHSETQDRGTEQSRASLEDT